MLKLTKDISSEDLEEIALGIINIVDYDIYKECKYNIEEEGSDNLVMEIMDYLIARID